MVDVLADNPLLLLFAVIAVGHLVGRVRVGSFQLGPAAVLFVGLGAGALDERFDLPEEVAMLGLVLFVYVVGVTSGPVFFGMLRRRGVRVAATVVAIVVAGAAAAALLGIALDVSASGIAGAFAGGVTNTPALAAATDWLRHRDLGVGDPVVGYSLAYPLGVTGSLVGVWWVHRGRRETPEPVVARTVRVTRDRAGTLGDVLATAGGTVIASRLKRAGLVRPAAAGVRLERGDLVTLIGTVNAIDALEERLGERSDEQLQLDRGALDMRRVFVSNPELAGKHLAQLDLLDRFGAVATRVRRGDVDLLADDSMVLELGDRVRLVAPRERMDELSRFFGDSYRALAEFDQVSLGLGVAIGLLAGLVSIPLPGGTTLRLGLAGGPLLVGLVLGWLGRTGPLVWQLSYNAAATLRQVGTELFLAGVGIRSGQEFRATLGSGDALGLFVTGAAVTAIVVAVSTVAARRVLRLSPGEAAGAIAGIQTQPAALALATDWSARETEPSTGYSTVYPVAMIAKIVAAQVLLVLLT